jgi:hypothetical protein
MQIWSASQSDVLTLVDPQQVGASRTGELRRGWCGCPRMRMLIGHASIVVWIRVAGRSGSGFVRGGC